MSTLALALAVSFGSVAFQDGKDPDKFKITAEFENTALEDVLDALKSLTGIPVEIDDAARKKLDMKATTSFKVQDVTFTAAVKLLVGPHGLDVKSVHQSKLLVTVPKK